MDHHRWDSVKYHGHPCIVDAEWNEAKEHWIMLRPTDLEGGVYVVTEDQLEDDQQDQVCGDAA